MKLSIALTTLVVLVLMNTSCSQSTTDMNPDTVPVDRPEKNTKKFKPTDNMVQIDPIRGNYTVTKGQQVYYVASVHGSVGYTASAVSSDEIGLPRNSSFIEYNKPQEGGMSGGDAAKEYFIFDALKTGIYEVLVKRYFRGNLEEEHIITVTVTD